MDWLVMFQMFFSLLIVLVLVNLVLKKMAKLNQDSSQAIKIIERVSISKNSALTIVEVANSYYLMSTGDSGSQILKELSPEEKEEIDQTLLKRKETMQKRMDPMVYKESFQDVFQKVKEKKQKFMDHKSE